MAITPLEARVRHLPGAALVTLRGDIDARAEETLGRAWDEATQGDPRAVVMNFGEVAYINSTGIALIVSLLTRAQEAQRHLRVFGLSDHYREIFSITRLAEYIHIFPDEASALAAMGA